MTGPVDRGLAGERTSLAWQRSALAHIVAGAILARALLRGPQRLFASSDARWVLAALVASIVVAALIAAGLASLARHPDRSRSPVLVLSGCAVALATVGAIVVAFGAPA